MLWLYTLSWLCSLSRLQIAIAQPGQQEQHDEQSSEIADCLARIEQLVLKTLDSALIVTSNVYGNLSAEFENVQLKTAIQPVVDAYQRQVNIVQNSSSKVGSYELKRDLLKQFKWTNAQIKKLRQQVLPDASEELQFQLISEDFLRWRKNITQFDNLYLHFMESFQKLSDNLHASMSKSGHRDEDLLEILTEINEEDNLRARDKLYDEFIEMYLFRSNEMPSDKNNIELA